MSDHPVDIERVFDLAGAVCNEKASQDDLAELDSIVATNGTLRRCYWAYCWIHITLEMDGRLHHVLNRVRERGDSDESHLTPWETDTLRDMATSLAPASNPPATPVFSGLFHNTFAYFSDGIPFAYLLATVITGLGLLMAALTYVPQVEQLAEQTHWNTERPAAFSQKPGRQMVGRVTGTVDCRWGEADQQAVDGDGFSLGQGFSLTSGVLEITYNTGAKVILQGPAKYEVESRNGGFMSLGKLTGRVEKPMATGFAIRTPTAVVTDLGTEFGVEVDNQGITTSHVFRGRVQVQTVNGTGKAHGAGCVLRENESVRVDRHQGNPKIIAIPEGKSAAFIREIPRQTIRNLDLVDIVAGGNGFSSRRNAGIDPASGHVIDSLRINKPGLTSDAQYHRVRELPFVDGVFIPDGSKEKMVVDSAGHVFDGFQGAGKLALEHIWAGGSIPDPANEHPTVAGGIDYSSMGHGLLFLHANCGITFDLDAIRKANPGSKLLRFQADAANTAPAEAPGIADIWVLVDGKPRFQRWQINNASGVFRILIPLAENNRFLTLVATDGGNGVSHDWIIFGDARLELLGEDNSSASPQSTAIPNPSVGK
jgi:hypothetical protein